MTERPLAGDSRRALVTGGAGFIGANLVRTLLAEGWQLTVFDNLSSGPPLYLEGLPIDLIRGDILDTEALKKIPSGLDAVVHLAAQTGVPNSIANPRKDLEVNVLGTFNMLETARQSGVRRFVFASSNAPLGRQQPPAHEDKAALPISPYGASKLAGEAYCLAYHGSWGVGSVVLRFANVYGPYSKRKSSVVARFLNDIMMGSPVTIHGDGAQTRDFVYVGDLCNAISAALSAEISGEVFQIATGQSTSVAELVDLIEIISKTRVERQFAPLRLADIADNYSVIEKANRLLHWKPATTLKEGLTKTWEWFTKEAC